ncbi:alpha-galactosidase [Ruminococcaceae bacterium OttesenSCG-928-L11]|nr:alpha-galactosidase [Ruminococcaceae bacterium OttesenSCG-928-L11]
MLESLLHDSIVQVRTDGGSADAIAVTKTITRNRMRVTLKNTGTEPVAIREIALFAGEIPVSDSVSFYGEGYHMLSQYRGTADSIEVVGSYGDDKSFFSLPDNPHDGKLYVLYYLLELTDGGQTALLAFTSCEKFLGKIRFRGKYLEIVQDAENLALAPGATWNMEELSLFTGTDRAALYESMAAAINDNHPPMVWDTIPTGWCSYYCMGKMEPQGLYDNAAAMSECIPELGMIQIDAGTNTTDGDWLTPRFEDDLATICRKVREQGVEAGGYCSPFIVNMDSNLAGEHPDWLVKDETGKPTNRCSHNKSWYILDGSHPEARAYLRKIVRYMHDECGLRYFKLDFLSYGALPAGTRYDASMTSVEAYRLGMKAIVEEVGADSFVLACNAPFWPTLGLCHGNRTTNDIFRDWKHVRMNALEQFYRNWQHQRLWINDPDCIVLEKLDIERRNGIRPSTLTDDEFEFHKAFAIACGGMILSGDLLYELSERNIDALCKMMDSMGESAVFDDTTHQVGRFREKRLLCLFNWEDTSKTLTVPMEGAGQLTNLWTGAPVCAYSGGSFAVELPAHGGMVLTY